MSRHSRALAGLTLVIAVGVGGLILTRQMIAVAGEADAERLNRADAPASDGSKRDWIIQWT